MLHRFVTSQIFINEEENLFIEYRLASTNLNYDVSPIRTRNFAVLFTKESHKNISQNWIKNETASYEWFRSFMSQNSQLSLHTPEAFSKSTATAFSKHNVFYLYKNLRIIFQKYSFGSKSMYNENKARVTTQTTKDNLSERIKINYVTLCNNI